MTTHLKFKVEKKPDVVFEYLSNMQKFASVHPVISSIILTAGNSYKVNETLHFGKIPFSFSYPVTVEFTNIESPIIFKATVFKISKFEMNFRIDTDIDSTVIHEQIDFRTSLPIKKLMRKVFEKQHRLLFENIDKI